MRTLRREKKNTEIALYTGLERSQIEGLTEVLDSFEMPEDYAPSGSERSYIFEDTSDKGDLLRIFQELNSYGVEVRSRSPARKSEVTGMLEDHLDVGESVGNEDTVPPAQEIKETVDGLTFTPREAQDALDYLSELYNVLDPVPAPGKNNILVEDKPVQEWDGEGNFRGQAERAVTNARYYVYIDHIPAVETEDHQLPSIEDEVVAVEIDGLKNMDWRSQFRVFEVTDSLAQDAVIQSILESLEAVEVEDKR